jgi:hypothetical protein
MNVLKFSPSPQNHSEGSKVPVCVQLATLSLPNVVIEWLTLLLRILEVPGSNLGPGDRLSCFSFSLFPQSLQANAGMVP